MSGILDRKQAKTSNQNLLEIKKWTEKMEKSMDVDDWEEGIRIYWGTHVIHKEKL